MELPKELKKDELYVVSGSRSAAFDDIPWIVNLREWIVKANEERCKIAGVCFGHQVIAQALGGKDIQSPKGWGSGIKEYKIIDDRMKKYLPSGVMRLAYSHHDQVVELPKDAVCFLSGDFCQIAGFTIRNDIITFQGHPEFDVEFLDYLYKNSKNEDPELIQKALESLKQYTPDSKIAIQMMLDTLENKL